MRVLGWLRERRRRWVTALVVVVLLLAASRLRSRQPLVEVTSVQRGSLVLAIKASGKVDGVGSDLSFNDTGRISDLYVAEGQEIHAEQTLARMELGPSPVLTRQGPTDVIRAPYNGWVVNIYQRQGVVVAQGTPVMRVVKRQVPWVTAFIDSEDAAYLKPRQKFVCRAGGYLARPWHLEVERIGEEAVVREDVPGSARQVRVRMRALDAGFTLPVGTPVDVDGEVTILDDGLLMPASALVRENGKAHVWVYREGRVQSHEVFTGPNNFKQIQVLNGLSEGEQVVVEGKTKLHDGGFVRWKQWQQQEP